MSNRMLSDIKTRQALANSALLDLQDNPGRESAGFILKDLREFIRLSCKYDRRGPLVALRDCFPDFFWEYRQTTSGIGLDKNQAEVVRFIASCDYIFNIATQAHFMLARRRAYTGPLRRFCFTSQDMSRFEWNVSLVKAAHGTLVYYDEEKPAKLGFIDI